MLDRMVVGDVPRKHHIALRSRGGELRYEECFTRDGFDGPYTILYHLGRPHEHQSRPLPFELSPVTERNARGLAKRHYHSGQVPSAGAPLVARRPLLHNADVTVGVLRPDAEDSVYVTNADGDDLYYVHEGGGVLKTPLGDVRFEEEDYVFVPRGMVHRLVPDRDTPQFWLFIECTGGMGIPKQWRNPVGQLRMDAPYCHRDFRRPVFSGPVDEGIRTAAVKRGGVLHGFELSSSPFDVVGWDGSVYPWAFPILNFQPRVGLVHLPPTWHGTFAARGALICSFVPRLVDFHPDAVPCPYPHSSVDVDEVLFYCKGNFTSRRGVGSGSISHHPAGIPHGPHPGAYEASIGTRETSELAVMLDCYLPLSRTAEAAAVEDPGYEASFRAG